VLKFRHVSFLMIFLITICISFSVQASSQDSMGNKEAGIQFLEVPKGSVSWDGHVYSTSLKSDANSAPKEPTLLSPADGAFVSGTSVTFRWEAAERAENYRLHIVRQSDGTVFYSRIIGNTTGYTFSNFSDDGERYCWQVMAGNDAGWSSYSDTLCFTNQGVPDSSKRLGDLQIGDKVVDNSWGWEHRTGPDEWDGSPYSGQGEVKPITWIVVARDHYGPGSGVTLLAEEIIGRFPFDTSSHIQSLGHNHWGQSGTHSSAEYGLRPWLNSTGKYAGQGFFAALPQDLQNSVITTSLPNKDWEHGSVYTTQDKVFIPSATELGYTAHEFTYPIGQVYPYFSGTIDAGRRALLDGSHIWYWTRSPDLEFSYYGAIICSTGEVIYDYVDDSRVGVRPALNLKSDTKVAATPNADGAYELMASSDPQPTAPLEPTPVYPEDGSNVSGINITFSWEPSPGATHYIINVSRPDIYMQFCFEDDTIGTSHTCSHFPDDGTEFEWSVAAANEHGMSHYAYGGSFVNGEPQGTPLPSVLMLLLDDEE